MESGVRIGRIGSECRGLSTPNCVVQAMFWTSCIRLVPAEY